MTASGSFGLACVTVCLCASLAHAEESVEPTSASAPSPAEANASPPAQTPSEDDHPPHPLFAVFSAGGELGTAYAGALRASIFASPQTSLAVGGGVSVSPYTSYSQQCSLTCPTVGVWTRALAEARLITPYTEYARSLGWIGLGAGAGYLALSKMSPGPDAAVTIGGDLKLSSSLWFELAMRFTYSYLPGPADTPSGNYFTIGIDLGIRVDFTR
jgi:hypothetical protein